MDMTCSSSMLGLRDFGRQVDGNWILGLEVSVPGDKPSLIDRIETLVRSGAGKFVLDVERLSSVDSATMAELVRAQEVVRAHHGRIVLVKVSARLRRYLARTGLLTYFELAVSEAAALSLLAE